MSKHAREEEASLLLRPAKRQKWADSIKHTSAKLEAATKRHATAEGIDEQAQLIGTVEEKNAAQNKEELAYLAKEKALHRFNRASSLERFWTMVADHIAGKVPVPPSGTDKICFLHPADESCNDCATDAYQYECPGCLRPNGDRSVMLTVLRSGQVAAEKLPDDHARFHTLAAGELFATEAGLKAFIITYPCHECLQQINEAVYQRNSACT